MFVYLFLFIYYYYFVVVLFGSVCLLFGFFPLLLLTVRMESLACVVRACVRGKGYLEREYMLGSDIYALISVRLI